MAHKEWTEQEVRDLEQRIRGKAARGEPLTAGEDTLWGAIKAGKPISVRLVEDVDDMMSIDE